MTRTGIFGGTFNPVHQGHIALARWLVSNGTFDEIWLTLSPANPLKEARPGATDADRIEMLKLACEGLDDIRPCFVEFDMPRPSYTIDTLRRLAADHPWRHFSLIIGADNWQIFNRWRSPREIIDEYGVAVYPRPGFDVAIPLPAGVNLLGDAPEYDISSTEIRHGRHLDLLQPKVRKYIYEHNLYGQSETIE